MLNQTKIDMEKLRNRIPKDWSELYLGFVPWQEDCQGLIPTIREHLNEIPSKSILRTVWDHPEKRDVRVFIEVATCPSAEDALVALVNRLHWNQLAEVPEGPEGLGYTSFIHPEGSPPTVYFVQGNVCITVASFAREDVPVLPLAERLVRRLVERPRIERMTIAIEPSRSTAKVGEPIIIRYNLPWRVGENGFVKVFSTQGRLRLDDQRVVLRGIYPGRASVDIYTFEAGRETYFGHVDITIK